MIENQSSHLESKRIDCLKSYRILDTGRDQEFDDLTRLAQIISGCEKVMISIVGENETWIKSQISTLKKEIHLDLPFCRLAVSFDTPFIVTETADYIDSKKLNIEFYAGFPLKVEEGFNLGMLCMLSSNKMDLSEQQISQLELIAKSITHLMSLRKKSYDLQKFNIQQAHLDIIQKIYTIDPAVNGLEYIQRLGIMLSKALKVKHVLVGRVDAENNINSDVYIVDGEVKDNISYNLAGTPCDIALSKTRICVYPKDVATFFPQDDFLTEYNIESYIGSPIVSKGKLIGIVALLDEKEVYQHQSLRTLVEFLSSRISAEYFRVEKYETDAVFQASLDNFDGFYVVRDLEGRYKHINQNFCDYFDLAESDVIGKKRIDSFSPEIQMALLESHFDVIKTKESRSTTQERIGKDGKRLVYHVHRFPILDHHGDSLGSCVFSFDITKETEREQEAFHEKKLASLGENVALVAHELKNPLAILMANTSLLKKFFDRPDEVLRRVEKLEAANNKMRSMLDDLKYNSRKEDKVLSMINVNELVNDIVESLRIVYEEKIEDLFFHKENEDLFIFAEKRSLQQVITNLISNAADAIKFSENKVIHLTTSLERGLVCIKVIDTGEGIADNQIEKIFENFYTTKPLGEGTGIGLHFCKKVITSFGGAIKVNSELGFGSEFSIELPYHRP